eukprot:5836716-Pyramimonas_sp.AAC.1
MSPASPPCNASGAARILCGLTPRRAGDRRLGWVSLASSAPPLGGTSRATGAVQDVLREGPHLVAP